MGKMDTCAWEFYSDPARYADLVNGLIFQGQQVVSAHDIHVLDSRSGEKVRDLLRQVAFEENIATIGIENQTYVDYAMSQRVMLYEACEYDRQKELIKKEIGKKRKGLSSDEYLGRFGMNNRLNAHVTIILYYGKRSWNGAENLTEIIDFHGIPEAFQKLVQNYRTHVVEIRKLKDTSVFKTDV